MSETDRDRLSLSLVPTRKIIDGIKNITKNDIFLVAFKADYNVSTDALLQKSYKKMVDANADLVVANDVGRKDSEIGSDNNEVFVIDKHKNILHLPPQNKLSIARNLLNAIENLIIQHKM